MLFAEAEYERLNIEMIAEKDIRFYFMEQHEICCKMNLEIPKTIH